jgi:hypothetical protein
MKKRRVIIVVAITLIIFSMAGRAMAQDFQQLLNAVDKVEANLKSLVEKEATARTAEINKLRQELGGRPAGSVASDSNPLVIQLRQEFDSLRSEVAKLATATRQLASADNEGGVGSVPSTSQVDALTAGLTSLNTRLESYLSPDREIPKPTSAREESEPSVLPGLTMFGFVDASANDDRNTDRSTFGLDEMELDLEHDFNNKATVRADIEYLNDGVGRFNMDLEQGYLACNFGAADQWTFSFGKFNAPIGFESCDAPDRYQHSYAALSTYGLPKNLTGALLHAKLSPVVDAALYLVNGWDVNADNNSGKTWGMRWGLEPINSFNIGFSAITGPEQADRTDSRRSVFDVDLTYNVTPTCMIGGEVNYGMESKVLASNGDANWFGFLLMNNVSLSSNINLTTRVDYLKDLDGFLTGYPQDLKAFTVAPKLAIVDGLEGLVELKYELSDREVFQTTGGGQAVVQRLGPQRAPLVTGVQKNNRLTLALEMVYRF